MQSMYTSLQTMTESYSNQYRIHSRFSRLRALVYRLRSYNSESSRCKFHQNMFSASIWGYFEGIQEDFWFWQVLGGAQAISEMACAPLHFILHILLHICLHIFIFFFIFSPPHSAASCPMTAVFCVLRRFKLQVHCNETKWNQACFILLRWQGVKEMT